MWTMLELTKASQVANAELLANAELVDLGGSGSINRGHDEVGPYSISCVCVLNMHLLTETYLCSGG